MGDGFDITLVFICGTYIKHDLYHCYCNRYSTHKHMGLVR